MGGTSALRRFGAVGDIHAEDAFLAVALAHLGRQQVEQVFAVGDIADGRGDLDRCCRLLDRYDVVTVAGNHDRWLLAAQMRDLPGATATDSLGEAARSYLSALPRTRRVETIAGTLLLCHGLGENDMAKVGPDDEGYALEANDELQRILQTDVSIVVCGHTHRRMVRRFGALTVINAGTLHHGNRPGFLTADLETKIIQFYDVDDEGQVKEAETMSMK
jgi:predicted phosphodiesterase